MCGSSTNFDMKVSRNWLQTYFEGPLPEAERLADALTFHAFEIESVEKVGEDDVLDVKVTANRGHDCLSHRGIARELSAILNIPMKTDPLREPLPEFGREGIVMRIEDTKRVQVGAAAFVTGVSLGPSPAWLRERLESVGQRSINNIVDATNFVMFDIGMPTHAFDAETFKEAGGVVYGIRTSQRGEKLELLGEVAVELTGEEAVIMNAAREAVDIGGVKGGTTAELSQKTRNVLLSATKFDPAETRKASRRFGQATEAARRFENDMPRELPLYAIALLAELVREVAGGSVSGYGIFGYEPGTRHTVSVSTESVNAVLGSTLSTDDIGEAFTRLGFPFEERGHEFFVTPPFERLDIRIPEDLIEEVGRIVGYDAVPPAELLAAPLPAPSARWSAEMHIRAFLVEEGFSEVLTSVFSESGERAVLNKVGGERPFLRTSLSPGLSTALAKNELVKEVAGLSDVRLFEIGTVWPSKTGEEIRVAFGVLGGKKTPRPESVLAALCGHLGVSVPGGKSVQGVIEVPLSDLMPPVVKEYPAISPIETKYAPFSRFPYIVRDISFWAPEGADEEALRALLEREAGDLLLRSDLFDTFQKGGRTSYAFRLVFQSLERTLTDDEVNAVMQKVTAAIVDRGWQVR